MELKWFFIAVIAMMGMNFAFMFYKVHSANECMVELGKAGRSTEDISKICK